ncbi:MULTISPECIES: hypothetical protein [Microbacterium]|uniref:hypothetical protein n=1 Tax=Microbacterium TaxID=33882 RepID=UPI0012FEB432|nr:MULTISPECIES: hypothetical protein [Microbacterium]
MTLHLFALAPATIGLCCLAADRRRARAGELATALLMLVAMADAAVTRLVPVVWWVAMLLAGAIALSAAGGRRRGSGRSADAVRMPMGLHAAAGMVVMAALMLAMTGGGVADAAHHHGASAPALAPVGVALAGAYVLGSVRVAVRARTALDRGQYAAMAASVGLMSLALVV